MEYREKFAQRLVYLREQKGISQQELADNLNITRQSLSLYEKAERTINIELLAKIADFFNVSTDYLMCRTDTATMNEDIQTVCKVTGLSEKAAKMLIINQHNSHSQKRKNVLQYKIADYLLSTRLFWWLCYGFSQILNFKMSVEKTIDKIEYAKMQLEEEREKFENDCMNRYGAVTTDYMAYLDSFDAEITKYNESIDDEKDWFEFKKWQLLETIQKILDETIEDCEIFMEREDTTNAQHNPEEE